MLLGRIVGKASTVKFSFEVTGEAKKFQYCQVHHKDHDFVLCQITELVSDYAKTTAYCNIIGYKEGGRIKPIRTPFIIGTEVLAAEDDRIRDIVSIESKNAAYIGKLEGKDIDIKLDLQALLTKHIAVLAKSGSGKSYAVAVLVEEIIEKGLPVVVIDPHGEYYSLKYPNGEDKIDLAKHNLRPKGYFDSIVEYGDTNFNANFRELKVSENLTVQELMHIIPNKLTSAQEGLFYSIVKDMDKVNLDEILYALSTLDNNAKFNLINIIDYLKSLNIFSERGIDSGELVRPGRCSILNLKGIDVYSQQIIVYKLLKDLFKARKLGKISPFFLIVEEAHNFVPEKTFGDAKSSNVLINIASEGRKFGLGMCVVSQRPARVQKSVLSQCSTQMILKITNPNDLKAIITSAEGIDESSESAIVNLPVGTAMVTGMTDMPLFVSVRPRKTRHGGEAVTLFEEKKDITEEAKDYSEQLAIIKPRITVRDLKIMYDDDVIIKTNLVPAVLFNCKRKDVTFDLLVDLVTGKVVCNIDNCTKINITDLTKLSKEQIKLMESALHLVNFSGMAITKHSKLNLGQVETLASMFVKDELFSFNGSIYTINDQLRLISHPQDYSCFAKVEYQNIEFDNKFEKTFEVDTLKKRLELFLDIEETKECYLIEYNIKN